MASEGTAPVVREEVSHEGVCNIFTAWWKERLALRLLLCSFAVVSVVNMILSFELCSRFSIKVQWNGIYFHPSLQQLVRNGNLDNILVQEGVIKGFPKISVEQNEEKICIGVRRKPKLCIGSNYINITGVYELDVFENNNIKHFGTGGDIMDLFEHHSGKRFGTDRGKMYVPATVDKLEVDTVVTNKISSAPNGSLRLKSSFTKMEATNAAVFLGDTLKVEAHGDINLESGSGTIEVAQNKSILLNAKRLPIIHKNTLTIQRNTSSQSGKIEPQNYLCYCEGEDKLFTVEVSRKKGARGCNINC